MKTTIALLALALALVTGAQAAGPLYTNNKPGAPQPLRWDTSRGPIPVHTDVGVFTYQDDGVTPFLTNAQADRITAFALAQWSNIATSTWRAETNPARFRKFTDVPSIGGDVNNCAMAEKVYGKFNGGGFFVIYDTDGRVLEDCFGVPRWQVLGVAFPEIAEDRDGDGYPETIVEATALMNGWNVHITDTEGKRVAGVFTHEFGHAINLSHSQVNGHMAYFGNSFFPLYPGVPGCVQPVSAWASDPSEPNRIDPVYIETMFPFIDNFSVVDGRSAGQEQSTVDRPDDVAAISNLYPAPSYRSTTGSISGTLFLKDGRTPYSGINVIARNVSNPLGDAVSAMTGDQTQGKTGPDGRYTINNLRPGQQYVLYIEEIVAGGYPTRPRALVSEAEYWNAGESSNPALDTPCTSSPITAQAGVTQTANFIFNGYEKGVQYTPVVDAYLVDLAKNGGRAGGTTPDGTPFIWDNAKGFELLPAGVVSFNASISRNGQKMLVQADLNGNVIGYDWDNNPIRTDSMTLYDTASRRLTDLGSLNGDSCGLDGYRTKSSSYGWALDDTGNTAVGTGFIDRNGDRDCQTSFLGEIVPVIWTAKKGLRQLSLDGYDVTQEPWFRAQAISGNGRVVLGSINLEKALAWIDEGKPVNLHRAIGATDATAVSYDGSRVALSTERNGLVLWNPYAGTGPEAFTQLPTMKWCVDMPFLTFFDGDLCTHPDWGPARLQETFGAVPMSASDMSDDGKVIVGRAGTFFTGFVGVMWIEQVGWVRFSDFFRQQGVAEAYRFGLENPASINGAGNELVGNVGGAPLTWYVDMKQVYVCQNGASIQTGFPQGAVAKIRAGAKLGRCEHLPK